MSHPLDPAATRCAALPVPPGKIIAVHLAYASRAAQRGRRPEAPSYFLKPVSSVAASGGTAQRPAGTELLAFEGEIALIIGTEARHVSLAEAWDHVGSVTAANDLGVYDLRRNDKGSNLRNKGADGFTPLGPALLDARAVDPAALRVRTWVDGELAQEDTTDTLLFPFAQLIADLSQHLTLERGDVILTGTPAGSSVVGPGAVVEVEVDAPQAAGAPSTGRLRTTIAQGQVPFDPALGSLPAVDDAQREEAWGSREAAGLPPLETLADGASAAAADPADGAAATPAAGPADGAGFTLTAAQRERLERAPVAGLSAALRARGQHHCVIDGLLPMHPDRKLVGTARTLRFVPAREDLFATHGGGFNRQKQVFDTVGEGEVIVIEARGDATAGTLGDILALRARTRGAAGVVTDGAIRDYDAVAEIGLTAFSAGPHPSVLGRRHVPWDSDVAIACGGATVLPGDVIVGDSDGLVVIPPALLEEVLEATLENEARDEWIAARIAEGEAIEGLFPMNAQWKERYATWRRAQ
ncbi:fumarylacetoacetate hydrolase family protein [Brachybacterium saurashtrense]|uniref:Fumarylacetoacetate hydrolase family protein n=1 Tax=Brachybacterium saurashtrense TaxID=556288 RepID=A0A345YQG5_9MICO|nr:fumarylacetoacetate hydrolase family protein [Brachybacterium saurashtrense]AXK46167.1 fumarylacetoacetate hydrolase family protein [Brachybacterium saurashtrense]RRR23907.1 fumarylacetoacetate hydrolase family protein [Brachybacterium saurashtrense]